MKYHVTLDRAGVLKITTTLPRDLLVIASWNNRRDLTSCLQATGRLAHNRTKAGKDIWLCPGVPEAKDNEAALQAAMAYRDFFEVHLYRLTKREAKVLCGLRDLQGYIVTAFPDRDHITREKADSVRHSLNKQVVRLRGLLEAKP